MLQVCHVRAAGALFSMLHNVARKNSTTRVFKKFGTQQGANLFAYLPLPEDFWSPVRPEILLTYFYRKNFRAQ